MTVRIASPTAIRNKPDKKPSSPAWLCRFERVVAPLSVLLDIGLPIRPALHVISLTRSTMSLGPEFFERLAPGKPASCIVFGPGGEEWDVENAKTADGYDEEWYKLELRHCGWETANRWALRCGEEPRPKPL